MTAAVIVAVLMLLGVGVRRLIPWLERARIPASVVAGVFGCVVAQLLLLILSDAGDPKVQSVLSAYRSWSGYLISLVFAGLLLTPADHPAHRSRDVWQQGICAWVIILGQLGLGLLATALLITPFYDVPRPFGQFIEVTMAGGFGSANSMASILESGEYHFAAARDLLVFGATAGLVWGVLSGLFFAQLGLKRGWANVTHAGAIDDAAVDEPAPNLSQRGPLEPILLQSCFLAVSLGLGLLMQWLVAVCAVQLDTWLGSGADRFSRHLGDLPLFFFALLGGWIVRVALRVCGAERLLDRELIHRLCGIAMDVLIVTSLASIALRQIQNYLWPVLLLLAIGSVWSAFCLLWVSPRILPKRFWFELGLINYGFSTAATAQGMMFLKLVDPKLKSGAAETYALGAPITAPFIGGGVITFAVLPPLLGWAGMLPVAAASLAIVVILFLAGLRSRR